MEHVIVQRAVLTEPEVLAHMGDLPTHEAVVRIPRGLFLAAAAELQASA